MALGKRDAVMAGRATFGVAVDKGTARASRWQAEGQGKAMSDPSEHPRGALAVTEGRDKACPARPSRERTG